MSTTGLLVRWRPEVEASHPMHGWIGITLMSQWIRAFASHVLYSLGDSYLSLATASWASAGHKKPQCVGWLCEDVFVDKKCQ